MSFQLEEIDQWREYFGRGKGDIFDIIERSILVAASDCPKEFRLRRDRIAELLFSTRLTRCTQCDRVGLNVPESGESGGGARVEFEGPGGSKESKANSVRDDQAEVHMNQTTNVSFNDAEALSDKIGEEASVLQEVSRINEVLNNFEDESDEMLFESLRKLQSMRLSVPILQVTKIGKTVSGLKRHVTKHIRHLARELIDEWKLIADEYAVALRNTDPADPEEAIPDSVNPSVVDDGEGLPFPPMDECAFIPTHDIDFDQFFNGMDDDGNLRNSREYNKNRPSGRRHPPLQKEQPFKDEIVLPKEDKVWQQKKQETMSKPSNKPLKPVSGPGGPIKPNVEQRPAQKLQNKLDHEPYVPRKPTIQSERTRSPIDDSVQEKMEATKRRLQESYQEAENAKRQRTIQVMELQDLPKQGLGQRKPQNKLGNVNNRKFASARSRKRRFHIETEGRLQFEDLLMKISPAPRPRFFI
ncbi:hypothetical protein V2J09_024007 [Rumex salicifolius]